MKIFHFFLLLTFVPVISSDGFSVTERGYESDSGSEFLGDSPPGSLTSAHTPDSENDLDAKKQMEKKLALAAQRVQEVFEVKQATDALVAAAGGSTSCQSVTSLRRYEETGGRLEVAFVVDEEQDPLFCCADPFASIAEGYGTRITRETYERMKGLRRFYIPKDAAVADNTSTEGLREENGDYVLAISGYTYDGRLLCASEAKGRIEKNKSVYIFPKPIEFTYVPFEGRYPNNYGKGAFRPVASTTTRPPKRGFQVVVAQAEWVKAPADPTSGKPERPKLCVQYKNTDQEAGPKVSGQVMERQFSVGPEMLEHGAVGGLIEDRFLTEEEASMQAAQRAMQSRMMSPQPGYPLFVFIGNEGPLSTSPAKRMLGSNQG